jgi:hypothetical protein
MMEFYNGKWMHGMLCLNEESAFMDEIKADDPGFYKECSAMLNIAEQHSEAIAELEGAMALIGAEIRYAVMYDGTTRAYVAASDAATLAAWKDIAEREYPSAFADVWTNRNDAAATVTTADFIRKFADEINAMAAVAREVDRLSTMNQGDRVTAALPPRQ